MAEFDLDEARGLTAEITRDVGGAFAVGLGYIGDRLGLFRALAEGGPTTSAQLADGLGLHERYVREWAKAMTAAGWIDHDRESDRYAMTPEQVAVFVDETSPVFAAGSFQFTLPSLLHTPRLLEHFREGGGIPYGDLGEEIAGSIDRMHRPWFDHQLTQQWIPGVPGLVAQLDEGIDVLDVGCGLGRSTLAIAAAWPNARLVGLDLHEPSVAAARERAGQLGVANATFVAEALESYRPDGGFDLAIAIDCVHDMPDPVGSLAAMGRLLNDGGRILWSEPTGSSQPMDNRDPISKTRACLSPFHCLTVSLARDGAALGTIIGEDGARDLAERAGLRFAILPIENPMQRFYELRLR